MLAALMHWLPTSTSSSDIHHTSSTQHSNTKGGTAAPGVLHGAIINIARVVNTYVGVWFLWQCVHCMLL